MRTFKDYLNEAKLPAGVEKFLKGFPLDANGWKNATGEIVSIANLIDEFLNINTNPQSRPRTPADFNTTHIDRIRKNFPKLNQQQQKDVLAHYGDWFK